MNRHILRIAEDEAVRFLPRIRELQKTAPQGRWSHDIGSYSKDAGAAPRANLDLTPALANLRKPRT